jgi:hypothetical protein
LNKKAEYTIHYKANTVKYNKSFENAKGDVDDLDRSIDRNLISSWLFEFGMVL